ncbi:MAG TPA: 16S rRNA (cytosine(1402)-N(4))-methyltransferase RsmH [Treponemataceae bacterium]|nr:16S rRNA (cytosine(1402)-N(4))-methyltransferase RsmH [Treponemataceae bacterium]
MDIVHTPVLLKETLNLLSPLGEPYQHDCFMVDSTTGEGGHSQAFLEQFPGVHILGIDADSNIQQRAKERLADFGERMKFHLGWFNDFFATFSDAQRAPDLILFDLGISVYHYERSGRGFAFKYDEPLDMRLNKNAQKSARTLIHELREEELANIIYNYGDERYSRRIARAIVQYRQKSRLVSTRELADIIYNAVPAPYRHGGIHPATKTFQAIRIAVNDELDRLKSVLKDAFDVLKPGGKMGVITFHSIEDRIVKNFFRDLGKKCICPPEQASCTCGGEPRALVLTRKPIGPTDEEVKANSPSRSAKLRGVKKLGDKA